MSGTRRVSLDIFGEGKKVSCNKAGLTWPSVVIKSGGELSESDIDFFFREKNTTGSLMEFALICQLRENGRLFNLCCADSYYCGLT